MKGIHIVIANLVPVVGVVYLGWKILALFLLFWLETVAMVVIGGIVHVARRRQGTRWRDRADQAGSMLVPAIFFGTMQLAVVLITVGSREMKQIASGDLLRDLGTVFLSQDLGVPLAVLVALQVFQSGREERPLDDMLIGIVRFFGAMFVLIPLGGVVIMFDAKLWALMALVLFKIAFDLTIPRFIKGPPSS